MTIASILPVFPGGLVMFVIGVIEGVKYLRLSDEEFESSYRSRQRKWFWSLSQRDFLSAKRYNSAQPKLIVKYNLVGSKSN